MALNFPISPALNDEYTSGSNTWKWNGTAWLKLNPITTADVPDSLNKRYVTDAQQTVIGNTSGSNSGDQTITLTGDVTGSGTGSFAATIAAAAVTLAKMANVATSTIFYRRTAGTGAPEVQTIATLRSDLVQRTVTVDSSATPSINTDATDIFTITALGTNITSMTSGLSGTPVNGQKLIIRFKDNATPRTITWGASFTSRGATLLATTVASKTSYVALIYNSTTSTWDCVATTTET